MGMIHLLSEQLASQIAAGEVIERPASVVKELVENALDAGATSIHVDVRQGGRESIQVADNGRGIPAEQAELAFRRHATSKLETAADLAAIYTLGFRGEALAAIAAVSQLTMITRPVEATAGLRLVLEAGEVVSREGVGAPVGTVMAVDKLFYNMPARLKFLKTIATEKRLIDELVTKYALAYPQVGFRLTHNGRVTFQTSGNGALRGVLGQVYGAQLGRSLLEIGAVDEDGEGADEAVGETAVAVRGFVAPPGEHRANRQQITLFVNGRWVKDKSLTYAVIQAYHTFLPVGRYPIALIFIELPADEVDVNVHPTKTEVRFREPRRVFGAVQKRVRAAILAEAPVRDLGSTGMFAQLTQPRPSWRRGENVQEAFELPEAGENQRVDWGGWGTNADGALQGALGLPAAHQNAPLPMPQAGELAPRPRLDLAGEKLPIMRVVGQIGASYIITEGPEGLFLVDQHAAHERIMYEKYLAAHGQKRVVSQTLVAGTAVQLTPDQAGLLEENLPTLAALGFDVEPFGPQTFMIRAVPAFIATQDPTRLVADVVADLERGDAPTRQKVEDKIIRRVCKTASIKQGQVLSRAEMDALIQQLEACQNPHTCPHGRPTLIYLSVSQLAKEFGRT